MRFTVEIDSGNEAVTAPGAGSELARMLRQLADKLDLSRDPDPRGVEGALFDYNGNRVGSWSWSS